MRNVLFLIVFFYILVLLQTSFFVYFPLFFGIVLNWVSIAVILINLFEKQEGNLGIFSAIIAGFFLDIFSKGFPVFWGVNIGITGFYIIFLTALAIFIKIFLKGYFSPVIRLAVRHNNEEDFKSNHG